MEELEKINAKTFALKREKQCFWKGVITSVAIFVAILISVVLVMLFLQGKLLQVNVNFLTGEAPVLTKEVIGKINILEGSINKNYYKEVDKEDLENGIYKGLGEATGDAYST